MPGKGYVNLSLTPDARTALMRITILLEFELQRRLSISEALLLTAERMSKKDADGQR